MVGSVDRRGSPMRGLSSPMRLTLRLLVHAAALASVAAASAWLGAGPREVLLAVLAVGAVTAPLLATGASRARDRELVGFRDAIASFRDGDFSLRVVPGQG